MSLKKRILQAGAGLALAGFVTSVNTTEAEAASWQPRTVSEIQTEIQTQAEGQDGTTEYTFKYGDTLWGISQATDISVDKLAQINDIENSSMIVAGNSIYLSNNKDVVSVEKGDRVESYDVSEEKVKKTETPKQVEEKAVKDTPEENAAEQQAIEQQKEDQKKAEEQAVAEKQEVTEEQELEERRAESRVQREEERIEEEELEKRREQSIADRQAEREDAEQQAAEEEQAEADQMVEEQGEAGDQEQAQPQPETEQLTDDQPAAGEEDQEQPQPEADNQGQSQEDGVQGERTEDLSEGYTMSVNATAYSTNQPSLSTHTATGINLNQQPNVVAVDPDVIPLGSTVVIPGHGTFIAGDTGGAINGNRIDIHMTDLGSAQNFGYQGMEIQVIPN